MKRVNEKLQLTRGARKRGRPRADDLDAIARRIGKNHAAFIASMRLGIEHAWAAGKDLQRAKDIVGHGNWLPWLEQIGFEKRSAQRYLRLYGKFPDGLLKSDTVSHLTLLKLIASDPKEEQAAADSAEPVDMLHALVAATRRYGKLVEKFRPQIEQSMAEGNHTDWWSQAEMLRDKLTTLIDARGRRILKPRTPPTSLSRRSPRSRRLRVLRPSRPKIVITRARRSPFQRSTHTSLSPLTATPRILRRREGAARGRHATGSAADMSARSAAASGGTRCRPAVWRATASAPGVRQMWRRARECHRTRAEADLAPLQAPRR
jgi:hypothetical protein